MHTEPSKHASNPEIRYEKTDAHVRPLYQFLFWISVITLITAAIAMVILRGLESWRDKASTRPTMAEVQDAQQPPAPRLQIQEPKDLAAFRKEETEILSSYGVVDKEKGIYRIPIEEAMKLTLERGLPTVGDQAAPPAAAKAPATTPAKGPAKADRP
jgi:hypothetical protein